MKEKKTLPIDVQRTETKRETNLTFGVYSKERVRVKRPQDLGTELSTEGRRRLFTTTLVKETTEVTTHSRDRRTSVVYMGNSLREMGNGEKGVSVNDDILGEKGWKERERIRWR